MDWNTKEALLDRKLNRGIDNLVKHAIGVVMQNPRYLPFFVKARGKQKKAAATRRAMLSEGIHVPPMLIASITSRCNLRCSGCYAHAQGRLEDDYRRNNDLTGLLEQADYLGFSIIFLAGGEPLTRNDLFRITAGFPHILFPLFTNGLLLDKEKVKELKKQKHLIPVISLEGNREETDARRGTGVYGKIQGSLKRLVDEKIFFGVSLTVTRENYENLTSPKFIEELYRRGARLFFFVEYVPFTPGSESLAMDTEERISLSERVEGLKKSFRSLFISFPGDEEKMDGCLAAGRGFVHVSADGDLEPCPFAPNSDKNLNNISLKNALSSPLLKAIRENHVNLKETKGGCALWENRQWVEEALNAGASWQKEEIRA